MRVPYEPENVQFWTGVLHDVNGQTGDGLPGFTGLRYQRGSGLGSFFSGLMRLALPAIKSIGRTVGQQALEKGATLMTDLSKGEDFQQSLKRRGREAVADVLETAGKKLKQSGGQNLGQVKTKRRPPFKTIRNSTTYKRNAPKQKGSNRKTPRRQRPATTKPATSLRTNKYQANTRWPY